MIKEVDAIYLSKDEPNRSCLLALRSIILDSDKEIKETIKYGMPCFSYHKKMICYLWIEKKSNEPYILFVDGKFIDHPKLEAGSRKRMKIFRINPNKDIPVNTVNLLLKQALDLHMN